VGMLRGVDVGDRGCSRCVLRW